jgi:hypothetical protein
VTGANESTERPRCFMEPGAVIAEIVANVEPDMDAAAIGSAINEVTAHRPRLRKLAQALEADTELLTSGRPEGPITVQRLIQALLKNGARRVTPPRCAHCGGTKPLPSLDGPQRICAWCDMLRRGAAQPCAICGLRRHVAHRDRQGRPRCVHCPPDAGADPLEALCDHIAALDVGLDRPAVRDAICAVVSRPAHQRKLLWELEKTPDLLTGRGAQGPPKILALIQALRDRGAAGVVMPPCPYCGVALALTSDQSRVRDGLRCCRACYEQPRAEPCSRCGRRTSVASRTLIGQPLCPACWRSDPLNKSLCSRCGRLGVIVARTATEAHCKRCWRPPTAICTICGHHRPCYFASTDQARCHPCSRRLLNTRECMRCGRLKVVCARTPAGEPLCGNCSRRIDECALCGNVRAIKGRTPEGPACRGCYAKHPASFRSCSECGTLARLYHHGLCDRCACLQILHDLLSRPDGRLRPEAEPVFHALAAGDPRGILLWLHRRQPRDILTALAQAEGPISHDLLDDLQPRQSVQHLRAALVAADILPPRDEHLIVLERWLHTTIGKVTDPEERQLLRRFVAWYHLRRLRRQDHQTTYPQISMVRREVSCIINLLAWVHNRGRTLGTCTQADIDAWLADGPGMRHEARNFIVWAAKRGHVHAVEVPPRRQDNLRSVLIADDHRWEHVRRLLHDTTLDPVDRVAGLLILLYAQPLTKIAAIRTDQITRDQRTDRTHLLLGSQPLELPPPLDALVTELAANTHTTYSILGRIVEHPWLFPGGPPGHHLSDRQLMRRLQHIGITRTLAGRNAAMMSLAAELPAAVLSRLLGLHINTATKWTVEAGAPKSGYAAEVSRRRPPPR